MISFGAFIVFLVAASIPATYIFVCSRFIEPAWRESGQAPAPKRRKAKRKEQHLVAGHAHAHAH